MGLRKKTKKLCKTTLVKYLFICIDFITLKDKSYYGFTTNCVNKGKFFDNSRAIFEYIKKDDKKTKIIFTYKESPLDLDLSDSKNTIKVDLFTFKGFMLLAKCKNIFVMHSIALDYCKVMLEDIIKINHKKHNIINLWHGIALKKIQYLEGEKCNDKIRREFSHYRGLCATSDLDSFMMSAAFDPISYDNVWITGMPRSDFLTMHFEDMPTFYQEQYTKIEKLKTGRKLVVYAPTYREKSNTSSYYNISKKEVDSLKDILKKTNSVLGIRLHPFSNNGTEHYIKDLIDDGLIIDLGNDVVSEMSMVIRQSDCVITDYSGLFLDLCYANKPMIGFIYDKEDYSQNQRGLIYDYDLAFPGLKTAEFSTVLEYLEKSLSGEDIINKEAYNRCNSIFFKYIDANNCKRVMERIERINN